MSVRYKRRIHAEAVAPWVALSFVLLVWWGAAKTLDWVRPGHQSPLMSFGRRAPAAPAASKVAPVDVVPATPTVKSAETGPTISPNTMIDGSDLANLRSRSLIIPVKGLEADDLASSFHDARGSRRHEAIDILAPRGTDVIAVEDGKIAKLFTSDAGGLTVYQFDPSETFVYYYAHLDQYAPDLKEGALLRKGDLLGKVGTTGNAPKDTPHLHFAISKLDPDRRWWGGTALDPFLVWRDPSEN
jgi:peptidoglycan LD-endopeptidase LytH